MLPTPRETLFLKKQTYSFFFQFQFGFLKPPLAQTILLLLIQLKTPSPNLQTLFRTETPTKFCLSKSQIHFTFLLSFSLIFDPLSASLLLA